MQTESVQHKSFTFTLFRANFREINTGFYYFKR